MHAISLLISHTSQGAWQGIRLKLPPSPFCVLTCLLLVSFPDPAPKRRERVWGLVSVFWVRPALGARADTASAQTNLESDWLVGSTVTFLRTVSHMTVPKL